MSEALALVKNDLGANAVILGTRTLTRGGLFGLATRSEIEITATADKRVLAARETMRTNDARAAVVMTPKATVQPDLPRTDERITSALPARPSMSDSSSIHDVRTSVPSPSRLPLSAGNGGTLATPSYTRPSSAPLTASDSSLRREVEEIRSMVQTLLRSTKSDARPAVPANLVDHYTHLIGQDVAQELAERLLKQIETKLKTGATSSWLEKSDGKPTGSMSQRVREELSKALCDMLPPAAPLKLVSTHRPTRVAVVGPTGVGKTTTIAKLAANMKLRENKRVGLITIDSYRIAAVEQLKTYAEILKAPLISVLGPSELRTAVDRMSNMDLILIDTAGRSQKDAQRITELNEFFRACPPDEIHLVLSTTSREATIREAVKQFGALGARHLIFTKLDEAVGFGVILNVLQNVDMRLSYLTRGQSVPDDIEIGSASRVAQLILDGNLDCSPAPVARRSTSMRNTLEPTARKGV